MQSQKDSQPKVTQPGLANLLTSDIKNLSAVLKPISKTLYQNNNNLLNEILLSKDDQAPNLIKKLLTHTLHLVQHKSLSNSIISIVSKLIICIKNIQRSEQIDEESHKENMNEILYHTIDIICLINNQQRNPESSLRVIQATFSLIDQNLIRYFSCNLLTRMFSICFECCKINTIVQNISISALFAMTQCLFSFGQLSESFQILNYFLEYLFNSKKFMWIKEADLKGLVWDLVIVGVRNFRTEHILKIHNEHQTLQLLNKLYKSATSNIFGNKKDLYAIVDDLNTKSSAKKTVDINDFTRYFKAYTYLSTVLSLEAQKTNSHQYVPFMETIPKLNLVCQLQRNSRMFIFMESICRLLLNQYDMPLTTDKGLIFMDILSRTSEQLCLCNESIVVNWESSEYYLEKISNEEPKVNDGDFVKLIRNTTLSLRQKFEKDEDLILCKKKSREQSARSNGSSILPSTMNNTKKWEHFIKCIIRVVRYLSSLNFIYSEIEEDPTRKIILQLQYWFLICPSIKAKNIVLEELLTTSTLLNNKEQAIKVSQCVQIGSNILYGYYQDLDSIGITLIMKMMAGIKADWEEGKSFEELDEVYNLAMNLFTQEKLIKTESSFSITLQALVQCANGLLADISQPKEKNSNSPSKRYLKMIDYVLKKIILVSTNNLEFALTQWNFLSAFFISLCFNKNQNIKQETIEHIGKFVEEIFKNKNQALASKKEQDIMNLYLQLSKSQIKSIEVNIIEQLKGVMPRVKQQTALMDGFRIVKIFSENSLSGNMLIGHLNQLQQILVKECLFGIVDKKYLKLILDGLQIKVSEKNEQYRLISLLWTISDHFRDLSCRQNALPQQFIPLWQILIAHIWKICENSRQSETKQSSIHTLTQILGQNCSILSFSFILEIIQKYFKNIVLILLGIVPSGKIEEEKISETAKIGIKNYIKMFKKLISYDKKDGDHERKIKEILKQTNTQIIEFLRKERQSQRKQTISLELIYELESMILQFIDDRCFDVYEVNIEMKELFEAVEEYIKMCQQKNVQKIDLNSHLYKKKVKPFIEKVKDNLYGKPQ